MSLTNIVKAIDEMYERIDMNDRPDSYDMKKWLNEIASDIDAEAEARDEYEMELRDEARMWEAFYEEAKQQIEELMEDE